jgi:hypothetical protein
MRRNDVAGRVSGGESTDNDIDLLTCSRHQLAVYRKIASPLPATMS